LIETPHTQISRIHFAAPHRSLERCQARLIQQAKMDTQLDQLVPLSVYRQPRGHVFSSEAALKWFIRTHRPALVKSGALVKLTQRWFARPEQFDEYVMQLALRSASEQD
jgi:hypothetical protein